ncbi:hypothetical protein [Pectobacterium aroidearum]|uniref:hypothetical protein n=1 Tax=Pectobacterium aroidearum TaxID=1201031 RepID=UPI0032EDA4CD
MSLPVFILYAVPALFMAWVGYEIPALSMDDKLKYLLYSLCVLVTFVFKYYVDSMFKSGERRKAEDENSKKEKKIKSLDKQVSDLQSDMRIRELEHAEAYQSIEGKLSAHLKINNKCKENERLWSGVQTVSDDVISLMKEAMKESKRASNRTNRK